MWPFVVCGVADVLMQLQLCIAPRRCSLTKMPLPMPWGRRYRLAQLAFARRCVASMPHAHTFAAAVCTSLPAYCSDRAPDAHEQATNKSNTNHGCGWVYGIV